MTEYVPKGFNDADQVPTDLTPVVEPIGSARGKVEILTATTIGDLNTDRSTIVFNTTGAATATLPAGIDGDELTLTMDADNGAVVVTCAVLNGGNTLTFDDVNDSIVLKYDGVTGNWIPAGAFTATLSTV